MLEDFSLTLERSWHLLGSSKITRVLGWRSALAEEPVARAVRWHLEHAPDGPDASPPPGRCVLS